MTFPAVFEARTLFIVVSPLRSLVAGHAAAAHANAMLARTLTISRSLTGAVGGAAKAGAGAVVCHARLQAVTPRCCNSASPSREPPGAPVSACPRNCS